MHYYTFNIGDYVRDTAHLDDIEDLAYRRMLDLYYLRENPLPSNLQELAKLIRMRTHTESIANVLQEFFVLTDRGYVNSKADGVLNTIYDKSFKAKQAANKRWSKNSDLKNANALPTQSECNADGMLPINPLPINPLPNRKDKDLVDSNESPVVKSDFLPVLFNKFWQHYKTKQGKQTAQKAFNKFLKGKTEPQARFWMNLMLAYYEHCLEAQVVGYDNLHAASYINQKRWTDNPEFMQEFKKEWLSAKPE